MTQTRGPDVHGDSPTGDAPLGPRRELAPLLPGGEPVEQLLRRAQFFTPGTPSGGLPRGAQRDGRGAEEFYRERWRHDKVVRSTHGVNCTGSCSWKVYVKDGIITWETQQTDYPSVGPDSPGVRAARVPARRVVLLVHLLARRGCATPMCGGRCCRCGGRPGAGCGDPVPAWAEITGDPERAARYKSARGKGGFVRSSWPEVSELIAAAHVHTVKGYGPGPGGRILPDPGDVAGVLRGGNPVPVDDRRHDPVLLRLVRGHADRLAAGVRRPDRRAESGRLVELVLPDHLGHQPADHPHAGRALHDRGPLPGQKVVVVSPDYSDHTKFADDWLAAAPGTDGALAMAMGHVILTEFFRDRQVPYFTDYVKTYTDLPFLVTLRERGAATSRPGS